MKLTSRRRGYFGIGIFHTKTEGNVGTLWRHAQLYGADFIFTIGKRYKKQSEDTTHGYKHIPLYHYSDYEDFIGHVPYDCPVICVELNDGAKGLNETHHPERAIYLLGAEDHGIPADVLHGKQCIQIEAPNAQSMNVATAGTLVMYDRFIKGEK